MTILKIVEYPQKIFAYNWVLFLKWHYQPIDMNVFSNQSVSYISLIPPFIKRSGMHVAEFLECPFKKDI